MPIDRCVCRQIPFEELRDIAAEESLGFEALLDSTGCGSSCGLCVPYIQAMLATGRTTFPVMSPRELERMCKGGQAAEVKPDPNSQSAPKPA
ncbi:MAG: (2Fe-2S)-binding protein [Phycisphaerales bacterium]